MSLALVILASNVAAYTAGLCMDPELERPFVHHQLGAEMELSVANYQEGSIRHYKNVKGQNLFIFAPAGENRVCLINLDLTITASLPSR
jgi:hypothetical protein